jgi:HK97 family phage prohead protease
MRINNFKKNPVVLWGHDMHSPPIGRINPKSIEVEEEEVTADILFDEGDPFAKLISQKVDNGFINAGSIRFIPITVSNEPVLPKQKGSTITEYELLEFSMVTVPANTEALRRDVGLIDELKAIDDDRAKEWAKQLKEITAELLKKEENDGESIVWFSANIPGMMEKAVTEGIQKALNPLLMDEFQYKDEQGEPEWILLANAMINLFHNKTLPDYQKRYVYDHFAEQYKKFDRKPPEFGKEPEEEKESDEKFTISDDSINKIIETVTKK